MTHAERLSRRTVLRGAGVLLALPWLESLARATGDGAKRPEDPPLRFLFVSTPNGAQMDRWTPAAEGELATLPPTLEPLAPFASSLLVLSGLTHDKARANGDGPGDHARAAAAFLTAAQPKKTAGADFSVGISVDQVIAGAIGGRTRLRSLELGTEPGRAGGQCDSGYACAYSSNISWRGPSTPSAKEIDPRLAFERLFSDGPRGESEAARAERLARRKSLLDSVREDARALERRLSAADRARLDEYESGIRELERRLQDAERSRANGAVADGPLDGKSAPSGIPKDFGEHVKLLSEILALAFATDSTRIATLMLANEGSNRPYPDLGVPEGHHEISHHGDIAEKREKVARIDRFHVELFADLLSRLASRREADGTLLDHALVLYGSGISDGNKHNHDDLPILLAGRGGSVRSGRHIVYPRNTPCANLYLALLAQAGVPRASFGDSTGVLAGL